MLLAAVAIALLVPSAAHAAADPLADAVARVTAATKADNRATAEYDAAQTHYYELQDEQVSTQRTIDSLTVQQRHLAALGRLRAVIAYKRGSLFLSDVFGNGSDILDAARRTTMLNDVSAKGDDVMTQLSAVTGELHDRQAALRNEVAHAKTALAAMNSQEHATEVALAVAGRAENDLATLGDPRGRARKGGRVVRERCLARRRYRGPDHRERHVGVSGAGSGLVHRHLRRAARWRPPAPGQRPVLADRHAVGGGYLRVGVLSG